MAIVTTAKRADFEFIHKNRHIRQFMDFVLVREDYRHAKPHPEPGIDCAIVHNAFTQGQDFSQATYRINTLTELPDLVLGAS